MASKKVDFIIVGQGLAGSILALKLIQYGKRVMVLDDGLRYSSSRVAAGLMDPITGKRLAKSWKADQAIPFSLGFYRFLESQANRSFFTARKLVRFFTTKAEAIHWSKRVDWPINQPYVDGAVGANSFSYINCARGGVRLNGAGNLDTKPFLKWVKQFLIQRDAYQLTSLRYDKISHGNSGVQWQDIESNKLIFCEGFRGYKNPHFHWVPFNCAKGEIITGTLSSPSLDTRYIYTKGKWVLPLSDTIFKFGSNYDRECWDCVPTEFEKKRLSHQVSRILKAPFSITQHEAGVRPVLTDGRPVTGRHPNLHNFYFLNGFASKGVMMAPYVSEKLCRHLLNGESIPKELSLDRF